MSRARAAAGLALLIGGLAISARPAAAQATSPNAPSAAIRAADFRAADFRAAAEAAGPRRITEAQAEAALASLERAGLAPRAAAALAAIVRRAGSGYSPPGLDPGELWSEAVCAKAVSRMFWSAFGGEDDPAGARGVSGDAWTMPANVRAFGGEVLAWERAAPPAARPGDIVGLHYALSLYNARPKPVDYTHLALVVAVTDQGPLIAHAWNPPEGLLPEGSTRPWPLRLEYLRDLVSGFPGLFEPRELIRPRGTRAP